jgi:hypothetical protein
LQEFAKLVGDPESVISQHLLTNPGLAPYAAAAADARMKRRSTGVTLTVGGFSLLGAGVIAGSIVYLSGRNSSTCEGDVCESSSSGSLIGLAVATASAVVGLAFAVPGLVKLFSQSETETAAAERYKSSRALPPAIPTSSSARSQGKLVSVPLFTSAF